MGYRIQAYRGSAAALAAANKDIAPGEMVLETDTKKVKINFGLSMAAYNTLAYWPPPDLGTLPAITAVPTGTPRNDFGAFVGFKFTPSVDLYVKSLGRWKIAGNAASHVVKLVDATAGTDLAGAYVSADMSTGSAGSFVYARLPSPVLLLAGTAYYLVSKEVSSGDYWYDAQVVTSSADLTISGTVYYSGGWTATADAAAYVPPGMLYDLTL